MKEERLKKMHEKRNEKKMIKNIDSSNISPEKDNISNSKEFSSPEDNILANLDSNPNENIHSAEKSIKIVNGKIQIAYLDVRANEDNKIITVGNNKPEKTTSMSFRQRNHTEKWTPEETKKFFKALEFFGSDFSMIAKFFNNRNRAQIKVKIFSFLIYRINSERKKEKTQKLLIEHSNDIDSLIKPKSRKDYQK